MKKLFRINLGISLVLLMLGCTKEVPYKEAPKDEQLTTKAAIDTNAEYIYVASNGESSRTSPVSRPFWMGSEKLVKFQFTEDSLQVIELDRSNLFRLNPTNNKLVLEIPISHIDYECAKDQFGECTNQEEENRKISWKDRAYFKPRFRDMKVTEVSNLPVELQNYFDENCYQETGSRLLSYELSPEAVNIRMERSFRVNLHCLDSTAESLSDAVFSSVYNYSIIRLNHLASPNYTPVEYPQHDENEIGYFTTELKILDPDNRDVVLGKKVLMNRWNPDRGNIVYNLNKSFYLPQNRALLKATELAVSRVNGALVKANTGLQITLKDGSDLNEGDLRNNFVILVDDPLSQGVIGYGPSAANPLTGEILAGRVVMYGGTLKKYVRLTYDEFVQREQRRKEDAPPALSVSPNLSPKKDKASISETLLGSNGIIGSVKISDSVKKLSTGTKIKPTFDVAKIKSEMMNYTKHVADKTRLKDRLEAMSEHCAYPAELINFEQAVADALKTITSGKLVPWEQLTESQKALIVDTVLPFVWVPTLVHEFGHTFGLRHNFAGSEDASNYYSKEELADVGVDHDITYSSVMDYTHRTLNELPTMGKYDIAALRFGYAREVEVPEVGFVPVSSTLKALDSELASKGLARRAYKFCTDEHVSVNPGCKRFDEGSNFTEIAEHFVRSYEEEYRMRHFRNGARNFSVMGDYFAAQRLDYTFNSLRIMFEIYERLNSEFNIPEELWETNEFLKDVRTAADTAALFFVDILQTPDTICAVTELNDPTTIAGVIPLESIDRSAMSCFDPDVQQLLVENGLFGVGEGGKSFKSKKDPRNEDPYADQIDQRGIWLEKTLAIDYMFARGMGNSIFDRYRTNFTHYDRYSPLVLQATVDMLMSDVVSDTNFELINGQVAPIRLRHSPMESHKIVEAMSPDVKKLFGLPDDDMMFDEMILKTIRKHVPSTVESENARAVLELFEVYTSTSSSGHSAGEFESAALGSRVYFALRDNVLALSAIRSINAQRDLSQLTPERIQQILADIKAKKPAPPNASAVEKRVYKMDPGLIQAILDGELKDEVYLGRLLSLLPRAI